MRKQYVLEDYEYAVIVEGLKLINTKLNHIKFNITDEKYMESANDTCDVILEIRKILK